ncbi:MAG: S-adenosylmethionine:tRNA ribosyltransferase-isomerase, partial [Chloroflexi bacterium]|nr:S-adenosylmethionine:tRNA ribosyltransferase-isomerase [Chloroflexota bacterium]
GGDPERYQTVFNKTPGSAAAPTAGLHFTKELLETLKANGVETTTIDLQVGLDTFAPVTEEYAAEHHIHSEWCSVSKEAVDKINTAKSSGGRIIPVGTTAVRTLETLAGKTENGVLKPWQGDTSLFILPGYQFKLVDAMLTNFHLPESTLLMLVSAFAGRETMLSLYQTAIEEGYRFFSFGDAMFLQ